MLVPITHLQHRCEIVSGLSKLYCDAFVFQPSGNAPGGQSVARPMPRQMPQQPMVGGMPRVAAGANMAAFNAASQAGMAGLNPGNIPMQRGAGGQSHPHQVILALSVMCY